MFKQFFYPRKVFLSKVLMTLAMIINTPSTIAKDELISLNYHEQGIFSCNQGDIQLKDGSKTQKLYFMKNNQKVTLIATKDNQQGKVILRTIDGVMGCSSPDNKLEFHTKDSYFGSVVTNNGDDAQFINDALKADVEARTAIKKLMPKSIRETHLFHSYIQLDKGTYNIHPNPETLGVHRGKLAKYIDITGKKPFQILAPIRLLQSNITIRGVASPNSELPATHLTLRNFQEVAKIDSLQFMIANANKNKKGKSNRLENINIENITFDLPRAESKGGVIQNGAILLQDVSNAVIESIAIRTLDKRISGQGINLLGTKNVLIKSVNFIKRSSGIAAYYATPKQKNINTIGLEIINSKFIGFNEAIDLDKGCVNVKISNNLFKNGARNSNEAIDSNGTDGLEISSNRFESIGGVLFFNGKPHLADNWENWRDYTYPTNGKEKVAFIAGKNLQFLNNTIVNARKVKNKNNNEIAFILGNSWKLNPKHGIRFNAHSGVKSVVNVIFANNTYDKSGSFYIQECFGCEFKNETHTNAMGSYFFRGTSEPTADIRDSSLQVTISDVNFTVNPSNKHFKNFIEVSYFESIDIANSVFTALNKPLKKSSICGIKASQGRKGLGNVAPIFNLFNVKIVTNGNVAQTLSSQNLGTFYNAFQFDSTLPLNYFKATNSFCSVVGK